MDPTKHWAVGPGDGGGLECGKLNLRLYRVIRNSPDGTHEYDELPAPDESEKAIILEQLQLHKESQKETRGDAAAGGGLDLGNDGLDDRRNVQFQTRPPNRDAAAGYLAPRRLPEPVQICWENGLRRRGLDIECRKPLCIVRKHIIALH